MRTGFQSVFIFGTLDNLQKLTSVALMLTIRQCGDYNIKDKKIYAIYLLICLTVYKSKCV